MAIKPAVEIKLKQNTIRYDELDHILSDPHLAKQREQFRTLSREYAHLQPIVKEYKRYLRIKQALEETQALFEEDNDEELHVLAQKDIQLFEGQLTEIEQVLLTMLLTKDPCDDGNLFLEVRAGTGGNEAAIFAGDLSRMYMRYADIRGWNVELISKSEGEHGGYKEIIFRIIGKGAYSFLKFESGVHRVQRVPETEAQGRIHTSTCTVAVLPEVAEIDNVTIKSSDLRIDTFRASGAGGQHVQKTDSAIRIIHLPTGTVVECQDERSQHKNRARAMALLTAKILLAEREKQHKQQSDARRSLVGTGDRSERIRTYNFPQGRLTDHRIHATWYQLLHIMEGNLDIIIDVLRQEHHIDLVSALEKRIT